MANNMRAKFPDFLISDINLFFNLVEKYFSISNINDELSKFDMLTLNLPSDVLSKVRDLVLHRPRNNPYTILKNSLIQNFVPNDNAKVNSLLNGIKFSSNCNDLLQEVLKLSEGLDLSDNFLKNLIFTKLPNHLQIHALSLNDNLTLFNYCNRLDNINNISLNSSNDNFHDLHNAISSLKIQINDVQAKLQGNLNPNNSHADPRMTSFQENRFQHDPDFGSSGYNRQYQSAQPRRNYFHNFSDNFRRGELSKNGLCYYHERYGDRAHSCQPNCQFKKN
jgi:hypothetical protein